MDILGMEAKLSVLYLPPLSEKANPFSDMMELVGKQTESHRSCSLLKKKMVEILLNVSVSPKTRVLVKYW